MAAVVDAQVVVVKIQTNLLLKFKWQKQNCSTNAADRNEQNKTYLVVEMMDILGWLLIVH